MIWVRRYIGFVLALISVILASMVMTLLHYFMWLTVPSPLAIITGIPTFGGAPAGIHTMNIMWWTLPGVVSFRWITSRAWRHLMQWQHAVLMWGFGGALTYVLGHSAYTGSISVDDAYSIALGIVLTFGFAVCAVLMCWSQKRVHNNA